MSDFMVNALIGMYEALWALTHPVVLVGLILLLIFTN